MAADDEVKELRRLVDDLRFAVGQMQGQLAVLWSVVTRYGAADPRIGSDKNRPILDRLDELEDRAMPRRE